MIIDKYRLKMDVEDKKCCTCIHYKNCKCLEEDIKCIYKVEPEIKKILKSEFKNGEIRF